MRTFYIIMCFWHSAISLASPLVGLKDLSGNAVNFETPKKELLVVFWATWCSTCKEKLSTLLPQLNAGNQVAVVAVNTDRDMDRVKNYVAKEQIKIPVFIDPDKVLRSKLKVFSVPHWAAYKKEKANWVLVDSAPAFEWERVSKALNLE